jgi:Flp pilus assembly protein TadG
MGRCRGSRQAAPGGTHGWRAGAAAVEFALVAPIIFLMFCGAIEITRLNFLRHSANNACYEGARKAVIPGASSTAASDEALRLLNSVGCGRGASASVELLPTTVTVSVVIPVPMNSWGLLRFSSGMNVTQSVTLSREVL